MIVGDFNEIFILSLDFVDLIAIILHFDGIFALFSPSDCVMDVTGGSEGGRGGGGGGGGGAGGAAAATVGDAN